MISHLIRYEQNPFWRWIMDFDPVTGIWSREVQMMDIMGVWVVRSVDRPEAARAMAEYLGLPAKARGEVRG